MVLEILVRCPFYASESVTTGHYVVLPYLVVDTDRARGTIFIVVLMHYAYHMTAARVLYAPSARSRNLALLVTQKSTEHCPEQSLP
jgi:hypothetical protein